MMNATPTLPYPSADSAKVAYGYDGWKGEGFGRELSRTVRVGVMPMLYSNRLVVIVLKNDVA